MVSPEILCHYSKGFSPWHFRRWSRRKLLKTCSSSAAPGRVISLSVPAGAFPMSFQFLSLINYYCASLCPKDELCHAWHLPDLVLAGGTLFSRYRSGAWSSSLFLQWPFSKTEQLSISQYFFFLNLCSAPCPAGSPPSLSAVLDQTCHPRRHVTKAAGLIILPGGLCSYFYIPFCCLPFSQQQNTSDWCSACVLSSHLILYCSTAA